MARGGAEDIDDALKLKDQEDREKEIELKDARMAANLDSDGENFDDKEKAAKDAKEAEKKKKSMTKPRKRRRGFNQSHRAVAKTVGRSKTVNHAIAVDLRSSRWWCRALHRYLHVGRTASDGDDHSRRLGVGLGDVVHSNHRPSWFRIDDGRRRQSRFQDCHPRESEIRVHVRPLVALTSSGHLSDDVRRAIQEEKNARIERNSPLEAKKASGK